MTRVPTDDAWTTSEAYEAFMGRWSRPLAERFVEWLRAEPGKHWLDVGCGTGALSSAIGRLAAPASLVACDPSEPFAAAARDRLGPGVSVVTAGTDNLPERPGGFDYVVAGLVLNFVSDPRAALAAMRSRAARAARVAVYVWDYGEGMKFLRFFWDEAVALDASAQRFDEGARFPICRPDELTAAFAAAGLAGLQSGALEIATTFSSFDDFWKPFLGGTGPASAYVAALSVDHREALAQRLRRRLVSAGSPAIDLRARAWVVAGTAA